MFSPLHFARLGFLLAAILALAVAAVLFAYQERFENLLDPSPRRIALPTDCDEPVVPRCMDMFGGRELPRAPSTPIVIHRVEPVYTEAARNSLVSGLVVLEVGVRRDGSVGGVCVVHGLPCGLSDQAIEAVRQWKFQPVVIAGKPADVVSTINVRFAL